MTTPVISFAITFNPSRARLPLNDRGRVSDFLFKLMENPAHPSLKLERVTNARQSDIWSARVTQDHRLIIRRDGGDLQLLYVDHHDAAYRWAERHKIEHHQVTGALQIIDCQAVTEWQERADLPFRHRPPLFSAHPDALLLSVGVPPDLLPLVRGLADLDGLLDTVEVLPEEAVERLLALATGESLPPVERHTTPEPDLTHPDTLRRFVVVEDEEELARMLDAPLATWMTFLHPSQRRLIETSFRGPAKVTGTAGTGKTVVAMHRARRLARQGKRVLLTTYSNALAANIERNLALLCSPEERSQITVGTVHSTALALVRRFRQQVSAVDGAEIDRLIEQARRSHPSRFSAAFLRAEWDAVLQAQAILTWDQYRAASRAGRGTPLGVSDRRQVWEVLSTVMDSLEQRGAMDFPAVCHLARSLLQQAITAEQAPFTAALEEAEQALARAEAAAAKPDGGLPPGTADLAAERQAAELEVTRAEAALSGVETLLASARSARDAAGRAVAAAVQRSAELAAQDRVLWQREQTLRQSVTPPEGGEPPAAIATSMHILLAPVLDQRRSLRAEHTALAEQVSRERTRVSLLRVDEERFAAQRLSLVEQQQRAAARLAAAEQAIALAEQQAEAERQARVRLVQALTDRAAELRRQRDEAASRITSRFYDAVIIDEVQDLGPQELLLLATLGGRRPDGLMVVGDGGQRIYARSFSLRALGIDVRGRSHTLRINYRTTEQIRRFADAIAPAAGDDLDGGAEPRRATRSLIRGPSPVLHGFASAAAQHAFVIDQVRAGLVAGRTADEFAVFARTNALKEAARVALNQAGIPAQDIRQPPGPRPAVRVGTMHLAKGLEFKVVFVIDVSAAALPNPQALRAAEDPADREDVEARERQLLYVSLTRARDEAFVLWHGAPSPFLGGVGSGG